MRKDQGEKGKRGKGEKEEREGRSVLTCPSDIPESATAFPEYFILTGRTLFSI